MQCAIAFAVLLGALEAGTAQAAVRQIELRIAHRRIQGGANTVRVTAGDEVDLRFTTDEATTIHLHGYDFMLALAPGIEARMRFTANATGRYPISAHGFGADTGKSAHGEVVLLYLEVYPR